MKVTIANADMETIGKRKTVVLRLLPVKYSTNPPAITPIKIPGIKEAKNPVTPETILADNPKSAPKTIWAKPINTITTKIFSLWLIPKWQAYNYIKILDKIRATRSVTLPKNVTF